MPEVSVIMPVYNITVLSSLSVLQTAVDSIKNQTYQDWELILCDDGSTDHTVQAVMKVIGNDKRIRLIRSEKNHGAGHARNLCISASSGEYIAVMDADDISDARRLERQAVFLRKHKEYAFVGCNVKMIDSRGIWGVRRMKEMPDKRDFLSTLPFVHPSIMLRREIVRKLNGYSESAQVLRVEDYEFLMRLYACGYRGYNMQEMLFSYREDRNSYKKRRYRYRFHECRIRLKGFRDLGILRGHLLYVAKPLIAGMVPVCVMRKVRENRYGIKVVK